MAESELTMCDVLEEERELEEDAKAVLGDSDDTNCTYEDGYVPRQALYACKTCTSSDPGGICLACSYACHENHELVELYTKRNFRCDCGNKKFENNHCRLRPEKEEYNALNAYNQNFCGLYCSCSRPYPDASDNIPDEMIQCVMCEDWYHGRHLNSELPDSDDYGEMICGKCMDKHPFLYVYKAYFDAERMISVDEDKKEAVSGNSLSNSQDQSAKNEDIGSQTEKDIPSLDGKKEGDLANGIKVEALEVEQEPSNCNGSALSETESKAKDHCSFQARKNKEFKLALGPAFLPDAWRNELCRCDDCLKLYEKENCSFLLDEHDTIKAYEERGKTRNGEESQYDKGLNALSQLDRVKQIEAIHAYNNMKTELKDYLKTFADAKRTVCVDDIKEFFDGMQKRKRQRVDGFVPHFCR